uniref:Oxygen-evolving enhancer protein 1, chloroplastic n=1 Tax=Erythrolobus australicus TaxID=1077150 RepID=A0A7S1TLC3_9RHOD|eukprot:CAMPEP_0185834346 /NCGR_PEP_ID=MMETSP1353-20130828/5116_1 /TAXON_ID=1077150 /ORGANISM="Erythrolobus australicus, Strain CCMP3124" /LENGTH=330 /DNA_ID=CAMNT_0028532759 /DNA_START=35 /DNA_END=1027 /DNA_ORIENTATION=+
MECGFVGGAPVVSRGVAASKSGVCGLRASLAEQVVKRAQADAAKVVKAVSGEGVKAAAAAMLAAAALAAPMNASAFTEAEFRQLSYEQVKGSGLANRCPEVEGSKGSIKIEQGKKYRIVDLCLEPKSFQVEEEVGTKRGGVKKEFVNTKLMTRATYTLGGIEGSLTSGPDGMTFVEEDGIDYAATTVQLPGGERVPFLFTIKELVAKADGDTVQTGTEFGGEFTVPSYRTGLFLDPKGRGGVTGYDMAVALPGMEADGGEGQSELFKESNKVFQVTKGEIEMGVSKIDPSTGEIAGVFVSEQLGDTDMGAKAPKNILLKGVFYGRITEAE